MAQPAPARPLRLISACFAVSICFRAFQQEQYHARHLSSGGLSEDLLESNSTEAEECKVNVIADPLHEYFWLNESYSVVIYLFGLAYLFFGLGYVCEEYFVQSIERIILVYQVPPDVAGATLMAAGSSAPELFAEIVGCFLSKENGAGTGTVIGSAVFNQLIIIGGALILSPTPSVKLEMCPLVRDLGFCILSYIELVQFTLDGEVKSWEAWTLFATYILYVIVNVYWSRIMNKINKNGLNPNALDATYDKADAGSRSGDLSMFVEGGGAEPYTHKSASTLEEETGDLDTALMSDQYVQESDAQHHPESRFRNDSFSGRVRSRYSQDGSFHWAEDELHSALGGGVMLSIDPLSTEHDSPSCISSVLRVLTAPLTGFLSCILLDCKKHPDYFWLAFANSITVLGLIVFFLVQWVEKAGCLVGFSSALMGLTVGAAGTSTPDALVSFHVAKNGMADMAVSNALGSNVFDILLCLGLPMAISTTFLDKKVEIAEEDRKSFDVTFVIMVGVMVFLIINLVTSYCKNKGEIILTKRAGYFYCFLYLLFVVFSVAYTKILGE